MNVPLPKVLDEKERIHLETVIQRYRSDFGEQLSLEIDARDEMYQHFFRSTRSGEGDQHLRAWLHYFRIGEIIFEKVYEILSEHHSFLPTDFRILDFACGYGRLTRFLKAGFRDKEIVASDIDQDAVDFCIKELGVKGFYSGCDASSIVEADKYHVITVISLFSHLAVDQWSPWLAALYERLEHGGILIFTTHGLELLDKKVWSKLKVRNGFYYNEANETMGRLHTEYYGSTYVTCEFVTEVSNQKKLGNLSYYPRGLNGGQDIYKLVRS